MCVEGILSSLPERYPSWLNSLMSLERVKSCKCSLFYSRNLWGSRRVRPLSVFLDGTMQTFRCLLYLCRKPEPGNDDIIHPFNVKIIIQIRSPVTSHCYRPYNFLFPKQATQAMRRHAGRLATLADSDMFHCLFTISFGLSFSLSCSQRIQFFLMHAFETEFVRLLCKILSDLTWNTVFAG